MDKIGFLFLLLHIIKWITIKDKITSYCFDIVPLTCSPRPRQSLSIVIANVPLNIVWKVPQCPRLLNVREKLNSAGNIVICHFNSCYGNIRILCETALKRGIWTLNTIMKILSIFLLYWIITWKDKTYKLYIYLFFLGPTILKRKMKKVVLVSDQETVLLLRAYQQYPCSWDKILKHVKADIHTLADDTNQLYESATIKQLKSRLSVKLGKLLGMAEDKITNTMVKYVC